MKSFSFRIRATAVFIFDTGISTRRCFDPQALRIRVSMSAIGSVMLMSESYVLSYPWTWRNECERTELRSSAFGSSACGLPGATAGAEFSRNQKSREPTSVVPLPAGFPHAGNHPEQRKLAKSDEAQAA